jgi:hypothetical protein
MTQERDGSGFAVVAGVITFKGFFVGDLAASHLPPSMQDEVEKLLNGEAFDDQQREDIRKAAYDDGFEDGYREGHDDRQEVGAFIAAE